MAEVEAMPADRQIAPLTAVPSRILGGRYFSGYGIS
jgi:hypothetical protein